MWLKRHGLRLHRRLFQWDVAIAEVRSAGRLAALLFLGTATLSSPAFAQSNDLTKEVPAMGISPLPTNSILDPEWGVGSWIWSSEVHDKEYCQLWRAFDIPPSVPVTSARLRITADNGYRAMLDGRELGRGSDWRSLTEYDVTQLLTPGRTHVLAIEGFNDRLEAGVLVGLRIKFADGRFQEVASDGSWWVVPEGESGWEKRKSPGKTWSPAVVVGNFLSAPWGTKPYGTTKPPPLQLITLRFWQTATFQIALAVVCVGVMLICLRLVMELMLQSKAQALLQRERDRIARDIHDEMGAELTQLVLQGELLQNELPEGGETRSQIELLCERGRGLGHALDEVVWAVNSRRDTLRDFSAYVCKYAQTFLQPTTIRCRLDVEMDLPNAPFDLPIRRNLFRAVREAINNAAKYSGANELFLRIHRQGRGLRVAVQDDGRGFDPASADHTRNGLANMRERLSEVGGVCRVRSQPGAGCLVEFEIPRLHVRRRPWWLNWRRRSGKRIRVSVPSAEASPTARPRSAST